MTETTAADPVTEPAPPPRPGGMGPLGWLRWGWRQLTSMRTALVLLFLVALGSVPGSVLPQRGQAPEKVAEFFTDHPTLAPWLDRLSMFDVFAAPWFAAVYILLFVSLAGCVIPRGRKHLKAMRARPPAAPRRLDRLPQSASFETDRDAAEVLAEARQALRRRRYRVDGDDGSVAAEKGHLGETGNLVFHLALLALLFAVGFGSAFGYRGNMLVTEGTGFSNSLAWYDRFEPGSRFSPERMAPFSFTLNEFTGTYVREGERRGRPTHFSADVRYRETPSGPERRYDLRVNHPLEVGGAKVYLLGHGYAPVFTVRDGKGQIAYQGAVPFLPLEERNFTSEGVIKAGDAQPEQLGFYGVFWPTAVPDASGRQIVSGFPEALQPRVSIMSFKGDLGLNSGIPQSVYKLEGIGKKLQPIRGGQKILAPGETFTLPDGAGSITFDGSREWITLAINRDPGRLPALAAAIAAILGLVVSFMVRRRRVWVRASGAPGGSTVVEIGGLTLGHPTAEFDEIVAALRGPEGVQDAESTEEPKE
ncbi:cytochrome c biogenesis protein ResB [Actinomadura craniellae]|uniref:Cytochrome c biogenesis protein ResB n=1 Tax=Actinomadura craniellae TaxID=2231787 RepID=A0A365H8F0_9ACTN|nr:cytochrome c biogenesis protein ResB [Actinomadura craniellae]RAY15292.1 cytochrome c biogenesis protein ResB [Actinomadura craniellae]